MKLRVTRRAFSDRKQIAAYIRQNAEQAAKRRVIARLDEVMDHIARNPSMGTLTDVDDVLVALVGRYPYKVFYRIRDDEAQILHIRHTARESSDLENMA